MFQYLHDLQKHSPAYFCLNLFEVIFSILFLLPEMFSTHEGNIFLVFNVQFICYLPYEVFLELNPYFPGGNDHTTLYDSTVFYIHRFLIAPVILLHLLVRLTLEKPARIGSYFVCPIISST